MNFCHLHVSVLITEPISYRAGIAVLWFINHHSGVTSKANFPISYVRGDRQGQVQRPPKPWAV